MLTEKNLAGWTATVRTWTIRVPRGSNAEEQPMCEVLLERPVPMHPNGDRRRKKVPMPMPAFRVTMELAAWTPLAAALEAAGVKISTAPRAW